MNTNLQQIADMVGVSVMTVSRALANKSGVAAGTRQRVLEAADQLGYFRRNGERRTEGVWRIGVLTNGLNNPYAISVLSGITDAAQAAGCDLEVHVPHDISADPLALIMEFSRQEVDALIYLYGTKVENEEYLVQSAARGFPCVLVNQIPASPQVLHVATTDYQGGFDATKYLLQLGHQRIALITGPSSQESALERLRGYKDALAQAARPLDEQLIIPGDFSNASGERAMVQILELPQRPSAVFASNDIMACGALHVCERAGVRIPADISLIGFDDTADASHSSPPLTTIKQPLYEIGLTAVRLATNFLRSDRSVNSVILKTSLIMRSSCLPYVSPPAAAPDMKGGVLYLTP
jgi:LacI family transcriptional regulator